MMKQQVNVVVILDVPVLLFLDQPVNLMTAMSWVVRAAIVGFLTYVIPNPL